MSNDPRPMGKPYLLGEMDYLKTYKIKTWEDGDPTRQDDSEYSEFQKPYHYDEDEPEDYAWWEWTWPNPTWPPIPPVTTPDVPVGPCSVDEDCVFAKIIGSGTMQCGQCRMYSQFHYYIGCTSAPWWAAFGSWKLTGGNGDCHIQSQGPVMATVCCSSVASTQTITLTYEGPLGCVDSMNIVVTCEECCEEFTLTGNNTVNPGATWTGTISPACPSAECSVVSNSGCTLTCTVNGTGSQVTVTPGGSDCGSFTVTVTDASVGEECTSEATKEVRINNTGQGGSWDVESEGRHSCPGACTYVCDDEFYSACIVGQYKWSRYGTGTCADSLWRRCRGCDWYGCPENSNFASVTGCTCCVGDDSGGPIATCTTDGIVGGGGVCTGELCRCSLFEWARCEWTCSC